MALSVELTQIREMREGIQKRFRNQLQVIMQASHPLDELKEAETLAILTKQIRCTVDLENALRGNE